jgi:cobalt-zinc-cadmium efflux system outer membrane protein
MKSRCFLTIFIFIGVQLLCSPLPGAEEEWTLTRCLETVLRLSPRLQAATSAFQAAQARVQQAVALPQPELNLDYDLQPRPFTFGQSGESYVGVSQAIPWPGKIILNGRIARREAREANVDLDAVRLELSSEVKETFYQLLLAVNSEKLAQENVGLAQEFFSRAQTKFESGDAAKIEMLKARVEMARAENDLSLAVNDIYRARVQLNSLLNRAPDAPLLLSGELKPPSLKIGRADCLEQALARRPDIVRARIAEKRLSLQLNLAQLTFLPDFQLGVSRHRIWGENTTWDVGISVQIPLWFWQPLKGEIAEARANLERGRAEREEIERSIARDVEQAWQTVATLDRHISYFEEQVLEEAEEVYRKTMFSYQEGEIGYMELIDARRTMVDIKREYAEALFRGQSSRIDLEKSLGRQIKEKNQ